MVKKKLNILLLLLLALLFTSLLSTAYAYQYKITESDIDLIVDRYMPSGLRSEFKTRLKIQLNDIYGTQNYDTCVVMVRYYSNYYYAYLYGFNSSDVTNISNSKNVNYMGVSLSSPGKKYGVSYYPNYSNTWRQEWNGGQFGSGGQMDTRYLCVPNDLGNNLFSGPWQSSEVLTFAPQDYFIYAPNSLINTINIENVFYYNDEAQIINFVRDMNGAINEADEVIPGYIAQAEQFNYAEFSVWNYNYSTKMYEYSGQKWKQTTLGNIEADAIDVVFSASNWRCTF